MGIALYPEDGPDPETLIKNANIVKYRVKNRSRDSYELWGRHL
jgi:GGDEF domain-containing protein